MSTPIISFNHTPATLSCATIADGTNAMVSTSLPVIFADEEAEFMQSVVHILKEAGFELTMVKKSAISAFLQKRKQVALAKRNLLKIMDGLSIIRYVKEDWPKDLPITILVGGQVGSRKEILATAMQPVRA